MTQWRDLPFWRSEKWKEIKQLLGSHPRLVVPSPSEALRPFALTPLAKTKVVMIFPEPPLMGMGDGVGPGFKPRSTHEFENSPMMFRSLIEELYREMGWVDKRQYPKTGSLVKWALRGVFMWNATTTSILGQSAGHRKIGWGELTQDIVEAAYINDPKTVFCFVGTKEFSQTLPEDAQVIFLPAPGTPGTIFKGSAPFTLINRLLKDVGKSPVNWEL